MDAPSGKVLGRYEIVAQVGRGAMGAVYKARDPKIDRFVAIKTILLHQSGIQDQHEFRDRFFIEAKAAGRLIHPGIVTVFDVGEEPETSDPYIVMEYVEGQTLRELLLGQNGRLPLDNALRIIQELAEALDYAHAQGVVHRDIKPANILVTKEGQAKIGDFGIAQLDLTHVTLPGRVLGTPAYMSPEQLEGEQVDGRSDLFSLGAILYSLLTGFSPFQGNSATTVCFKVANRDPVQVTALAPELPTELDAVISRALAKDPDRRYQRGIDFARDIQRLRERGGPPRQGPLWFSPSEGRGIWLEGATQRVTPLKSSDTFLAKAPSTGQPRNVPRITSSRVIAGPLISFFVATIVLGFFAWRQMRIATPAPTTVVETSHQANALNGTEEKPIPATTGPETRAENGMLAPLPSSTPSEVEPESFATAAATRRTAASVVPKAGSKAVPRTVAKAGNAASAINALPKSSEATTPVTNPTSPFADSNVEVRIDNHFSDGTLSISIDDKLVYEHQLRDGHKKKLILLGGGVKETVTLPVASGQHTVRVEVRSPKEQYDESRTVAGDFAKGGDKVLSITFDKHSREMQVTLGGELTSHVNQ
jgi:serine/threonine protein kinase